MQTPSNNETKSSDLEASCMILFLHELYTELRNDYIDAHALYYIYSVTNQKAVANYKGHLGLHLDSHLVCFFSLDGNSICF